MSKVFKRFSDDEQKDNERLARLEYGPELVNQSVRRWNSYSSAQRDQIFDEGNQIYNDVVAAIEAELSPQSPEVQAILDRWHEHLHYFYEPTLDVLRGLGMTYSTHPEFIANFQQLHTDLPEYLHEAIEQYVDDLEYAEIVRLLAEDADAAQQDD